MFAEGAIVGSYRVLRKLGQGGMGAVFVGEHTLLGRKAALKVLLPVLSVHKELVDRFFNEARAAAQCADPGIVQVFDFGYDSDGRAFIVMELLEGEALDKRLKRLERIPPHDCLRLMRLTCASLAVAHANGIVHRDLTPGNVFIVGDVAVPGGERTKLLDFGLVKLATSEPGQVTTRSGAMMGTPWFMSPEQCRGSNTIDGRTDIYSIGCLLMTMLTGSPPFPGQSDAAVIDAQLHEVAPRAAERLPGLPATFDRILQRCLAKAPNDRFQTMAELAQALAYVEQLHYPESSILAPPPELADLSRPTLPMPAAPLAQPQTPGHGVTGESARLGPRRRGMIAGIALIAVMATAAIVVVSERGDDPDRPTGGDPSGARATSPRQSPTIPQAMPSPKAVDVVDDASGPTTVDHAPATADVDDSAGSQAADVTDVSTVKPKPSRKPVRKRAQEGASDAPPNEPSPKKLFQPPAGD